MLKMPYYCLLIFLTRADNKLKWVQLVMLKCCLVILIWLMLWIRRLWVIEICSSILIYEIFELLCEYKLLKNIDESIGSN